jgi:CMD domain protein
MADPQNPSPVSAATGIPDAIDALAGISPNTPLHQLRNRRPDPRRYAQGSYLALLEPEDPAGVSRYEREMIALRVAVLTSNQPLVEHHRERLQAQGGEDEAIAAIEQFANGAYAPREAAILRYVDRLTLEPRAAGEESMRDLQAAGLTTPEIVTIAQLIAFLSFQIRLLAGLHALGAAS